MQAKSNYWPMTRARAAELGWTIEERISRCRGCRAPVYWTKVQRATGVSTMPLEVIGDTPSEDPAEWEYQPHWATCPNAEYFRALRRGVGVALGIEQPAKGQKKLDLEGK